MILPGVFADANVFVAAAASEKGGSRLILNLASENKISLFTVRHALHEAERNIQIKLGQKYLLVYYQLLLESKPKIQSLSTATLKEIEALRQIVPIKDVPILLGAIFSDAEFLLTLDKKDFLNNEKLAELKLPFAIVSPGEFIEKYLK